MDISDFLDHVNDKPKAFKFDTTPYMLTQLEKLNHPQVEQQQDNQQPTEDDLFGSRKYFDFETSPAREVSKVMKITRKLQN
jgi:hypothetical protein